MIGSWGKLIFSVSAKQMRTFDAMKRNESARWSKHDVHLNKPKPVFNGPDQGTITFDMHFLASMGVKPMDEIDKLIRASRSGEVHRLIIGNKRFGLFKYYIASINSDLTYFDNKGLLLSGKVNVTLEEYV